MSVASCTGESARTTTREEPEAVSLLGRALYEPPLSPERRAEYEAKLVQARLEHDRSPDDPDTTIWLGRRTAYLGRFREAIAIFTEGVERWPDDARMLRHRGHRLITLRRLDEAIADLERATTLVANRADEVEPDGLPNPAGVPTSTLNTNIAYHLGLAYFLQGDFENARRGFQACLDASTNDDTRVAAADWLWMALERLGRMQEAQALLDTIPDDVELLENHAYHGRLMLYKGLRSPESLLAAESDDPVQLATHGFGVGHWYLVQGDRARAGEIFRRIVEGSSWPAFGYIAAEAELARNRPG
jgi:tetratricopeptide (TPR) repeat protein